MNSHQDYYYYYCNRLKIYKNKAIMRVHVYDAHTDILPTKIKATNG